MTKTRSQVPTGEAQLQQLLYLPSVYFTDAPNSLNGHSAVFLHQLSVGGGAKINRKIPICFIIFKVKFATIKLNVDKNSSFNSVAQK